MKRRTQTRPVSRKRLLALLGMAAVLIAVALWVRLYLAPKATPRQGEPQAPSPQALIAALQQQVSFNPSDARAHHALGDAYLAIGDYAQAESALRQALKAAPKDATPRLYWGHFCLLTEDESVAIKHFRKAAELEPDLVPTRLALADAALKLGRLAEAEEAAREAVRLTPGQPEALCMMAQVELKKPASASALPATRQILEKAVLLKPDYRDAHYYLGLRALRRRS